MRFLLLETEQKCLMPIVVRGATLTYPHSAQKRVCMTWVKPAVHIGTQR